MVNTIDTMPIGPTGAPILHAYITDTVDTTAFWTAHETATQLFSLSTVLSRAVFRALINDRLGNELTPLQEHQIEEGLAAATAEYKEGVRL